MTEAKYAGPERRKHESVDCTQEPRLVGMEAKINSIEERNAETHALVKDLHTRLLLGNGKPAIVVDFDKRLTSLEGTVVPHDDVQEMLGAFRVGKTLIMAVATVAVIGFSAMLFWHFFKPATH